MRSPEYLRLLRATAQFDKAIRVVNEALDKSIDLTYEGHIMPIYFGAKIIERHITLDKNMAGPDHTSSLNYDEFKKILLSQKTPPKPQTQVDLELLPGEANLEHCERILSFAPFGEENQSPVFLLQNIKILDQRPVGSEEKHLKFSASFGDEILEGIAFNFAPHATALQKATSLLVALEKNHWNGLTKPQLKLIDFH